MKTINVSSCGECPHHRYTESNFYCKKLKLSKYTYREITDMSKIHPLCPLNQRGGGESV